MQFWCSALKVPWSWTWRPYVGVWLLCAGLLVGYAWALHRRYRTTPREPDATKRILSFVAGVALLWIASDWPVGLLGASYLASVHMLQYMIYTLGAAPLLLLGIPEWMARRILGKLRLYRTVKFLSRPLIAGVLFNVILIGTNAPARGGQRALQPVRLVRPRHDLDPLGPAAVAADLQHDPRDQRPVVPGEDRVPVPGRGHAADGARRLPHLRRLPALPHVRAGAPGGQLRRSRGPAARRRVHEGRATSRSSGR